jgi:hypothetical protein
MKNCKSLIIGCILAVLVLPLVGAVSEASAQNVLINGDFETGDLTGWEIAGGNPSATVFVQSPDNGPTLPGTHNAYLENFGEGIGLNLKQSTAPGTAAEGEVTYSFDLKLDSANIGGVVFVQMFAEQDGVGIVGGSGLLGPLWPWDVWTTYTGSFMAPAGTDFLTIRIEAATGADIGADCLLHADNVIMEQEGIVATEDASWSGVKALYR